MHNYNPFSLTGKTILVTGASSGIGRGIAIECSRMGASLIITGRNEERLQETKDKCGKDSVKTIQADLSAEGGINKIITEIPKLDGLVLAAGIVEMYPVQFASTDKILKTYQTNLLSPIELLRQIMKKKLFNPGFSVVVMNSIAGNSDFCLANSIYGSGKAALKSYARFAAKELAPRNIRINCISPGMILTPLQLNSGLDKEQLEDTIKRVPLKRWGTPEDIAYATVYMLSSASSYLTGSDLVIDGGYTI